MCTKKTKQTQYQRIGPLREQQQELERMLTQQSQQAFGQMGDLSGLAGGELGQLSPEMLRAIQEAQSGARLGVQQNYEEELRNQQVGASARGIAGSSSEAIGQALLGQSRTNQLADLDSQAAQMRLQLPMQLAQQQLAANRYLGQLGSGLALGNLDAFARQRMAQGNLTGVTKESGGEFGQALGFGSSLASGGAFGGGN